MRLLVRFALIGCAIILFLLVVAYKKSQSLLTPEEQEEADEIAHLLQSSLDDPPSGNVENAPPPPLTLNIAIVLIVSLLSVALLITGIIVVAVTMDPGSDSDEAQDNDENNSQRSDLENGGDNVGYFWEDYGAGEKWRKAWSNFAHIAPEEEWYPMLPTKSDPIKKNGFLSNGYIKKPHRPNARRKSLSS